MKEILIYSLLYLVLFGFTDLLYHRFKVKVGFTRKIVHICTGIIALSFPVYLKEIWQVAVLCGSFLGLMALSERFSWFKSITAVERKSHGSWLFAVAVLVCFIAARQLHLEFYYLPILILTIADPVAAIIGKRLNYKPITIYGQTKTIGGSLAFFLAAILISLVFLELERAYAYEVQFLKGNYLYLILIALVATVAEFFSTKGWDNITIPLSVVGMLLAYMEICRLIY